MKTSALNTSATKAAAPLTVWHRVDRVLARLRPHREPLSLAIDAVVVVACWNITYLFRLGFERWLSARPAYDGWVLAGVVLAYGAASLLFKVPQSMWRFSGFGEIKRITLACAAAGLLSMVVVTMLGLNQVPRAVLALHPVVTLMGLAVVRIAYRMAYEHARSRIAGAHGEIRRAIVLGAGEAARLMLAGLHQQGWVVLGLLDDDRTKHGARIGSVPVLGPLQALAGKSTWGTATHVVVAMQAGAHRAQRRRTAHRPDAHRAAARYRTRRPAGP